MKQKQKCKPTVMRRLMKLVCAILAVALAIMTGVTAYFQYLIDNGTLSPKEAFPTLSQMVEDGLEGLELSSGGNGIAGRENGSINILLIGQDASKAVEGARSDTMILCTFDRESKELTMTSFLRDMYLRIPGYGSNRINAAYAFGGRKLLTKTISENFAVEVDGCVEVDFTRFREIIDLLGGVEIELRQDEADAISQGLDRKLEAGLQNLDGQQALRYARLRKLDSEGDFGRTNRQRKVVSAMLKRVQGEDLKTMLSLLGEILPMVDTDMNLLEMTKYAVELMPMLSGMEILSQRIPADGAYEDRMIDGMSVLVPDLEQAREQLRETMN